MRPRVVILSAFLSPFRSGAEACAEEVPVALGEMEFTIVTARLQRSLPKYDHVQGKIPVIRVGIGSSIDKWLYPFLAPLATRRLRPHLVHAVLETFAGLALLFCKWACPSAKRLLTLQTLNRSFLKGLITRSPDAVVAISHALEQVAASHGRSNVTVIPNGIPYGAIRDACTHHPKVPGRILFVGRLEPMKGVDTLLDAFTNIMQQFPGVNLRIVGDGSLHLKLEAQSSKLGLRDRVSFAGFIPHPKVYEEFSEAEIFCSLPRSEALGNVFLEAQAAGCAVVGTNVGGIPEIVSDGVTGFLVPPNDPQAAAGALEVLLGDPLLRSGFSQKGQQKMETFNWALIAERYLALYAALLKETLC